MMVSRADLVWLGLASGVIGGMVGGLMLGIGLDLIVEGQYLGWLLLLPAAPVSGLLGWRMGHRLARRLPA